MNLLIALLSSRVPLSRARLREFIDGYHGLSNDAFEQAFERDKRELRALGVTIHTVELDTEDGAEVGYRVDRREFELPLLEFSAEEKAVLGAAAHVWQESVAAEETTAALIGLRAAGIETDASHLMTLRPQIHTDDGYAVAFEALTSRRELRFDYRGEPRRVHPWQLHMRRGQWYLLAFDVGRGEPRRFKLQRINSELKLAGRTGAYEIPEDLPVADFGGEDITAVIALHEDVASDLRRDAVATTLPDGLPDGFVAHEVRTTSLELLASEICSLGAAAIAISPPELVDQVVERLTHVVKAVQR